MIRLFAKLPHDRTAEGTLWAVEDARLVVGPDRCCGKADNQAAIAHGNPTRDPLKPFGDTPCGVYRIIEVDRISDKEQNQHFGPVFLKLRPVAGDAARSGSEHNRSGFGIHGGPLLEDGQLRPTNGCLRTGDAFVLILADLIEAEFNAGRDVFFEVSE